MPPTGRRLFIFHRHFLGNRVDCCAVRRVSGHPPAGRSGTREGVGAADLAELLRSHRLVTVMGPGGAGKEWALSGVAALPNRPSRVAAESQAPPVVVPAVSGTAAAGLGVTRM